MSSAPQYPFDPTGSATTNLVNEVQNLVPSSDWSDFYFIVPKATPYFASSLKLTLQPSGKILKEGVDYNPSHRFYDASQQCASPVYGSITFLDRTLAGLVQMSYQTLGGDWTVDSQTITEILANTLMDPRTTTWEEVVDLPYQFPPIDHEWDIVDMTGAADIVNVLDQMVQALLQSGDQGLAQHLADFNNPHRVTQAQVGLGLVQNFGLATTALAQAGTDNQSYMTPQLTSAAITAQALAPLNAHISNVANPHNTTKAQVGLGAVNNFGWASTSDAQAGTATNGYMNAALTSAAITALALTPLNAHLADTNNPHGTTATQVGLGNVGNYPMATTTEALAGTASDRYMSPATTMAVLQSGVGGNLQAHINDHNNPHVVTATQVGLGNVQNYGIATNADALAGTSNILYMTPALTLASITNQITPFANHITNTANPHNTTAAQVGLGNVSNYATATNADAQTGTATNLFMTPATTTAAITQMVLAPLNAHTSNTNNPHNVTAAQVGAYTTAQIDTKFAALSTTYLGLTAQAADSAKLQGKTVSDILAMVPTPPSAVVIRFQYPAVTTAGSLPTDKLYSQIAVYNIPTTPDPTNTPTTMELLYVGGEATGAPHVEPGQYRVWLNISNTAAPTVEYVCIGGDPSQSFLATVDSSSGEIGLWAVTAATRNPVTITVVSDPGGQYGGLITTQTTAPTNASTGAVKSTLADPLFVQASPNAGEVMMGAPFIVPPYPSTRASSAGVVMMPSLPVQFLNVAISAGDITACQAVTMPIKTEWRHFGRVSAFADKPMRATRPIAWTWDNTNSLIKCGSAVQTLESLTSPEPVPAATSFSMEMEVSSTDAGDRSIGVCIGHVVYDGKAYGVWAMRTPGGTVYDSQHGLLPDSGAHGLFTVGLNLFQNDSVIWGATNAGLTWGDGVSGNTDRTSSPYVPQSVTPGTNGWASKGKVRIRVTYDQGGNTLTVETTDFNSTTYVAAAKQTINLAGLLDQGSISWRYGMGRVGGHWGPACYYQMNSEFNIISCPDQNARYVTYSANADGSDTSTLNFYSGVVLGWLSMSIATEASGSAVLMPGRIVYSEYNDQLYLVRRDSTLTPMPIIGASGTGQPILTT